MSEPQVSKSASSWVLWLPAIVFAMFVAVVAYNLRNPAEKVVRSALVGKPLPEFSLPPAAEAQPGLARTDMADGKVRVLNVFASWCVPCAVEAPQLAFLRNAGVEVVGVAIRDRPDELRAFLARHGNPFTRIGADNVSAIQFALGSSGVPESFVIDGKGVIRYQHIGEIRAEHMPMLLDQIDEAKK